MLEETHEMYLGIIKLQNLESGKIWWAQSHVWRLFTNMLLTSGFVPFFRNKFPGLFQDSEWFFKGSKIHINPYTHKFSTLILLTAFQTLHIHNFPGPVTFFQDVPVLENAIIKFQDFPGFPGPARTLLPPWQRRVFLLYLTGICITHKQAS